jgi:serine/threonine protein kinase
MRSFLGSKRASVHGLDPSKVGSEEQATIPPTPVTSSLSPPVPARQRRSSGAPPVPAHKVVSLEDFEIQKLIGRGSFGKVYLVKKKSDGQVQKMSHHCLTHRYTQ